MNTNIDEDGRREDIFIYIDKCEFQTLEGLCRAGWETLTKLFSVVGLQARGWYPTGAWGWRGTAAAGSV